MKKITFPLILIIILGVIFIYWNKIEDLYLDFFQRIDMMEKVKIDFPVIEFKEKVLTPGPLRAPQESLQSFLTKSGVIQWTNIYREENGLLSLSENKTLNVAAALKLEDMFEEQYFAHVSPSGLGVIYFLEEVDYDFIVSGENLAMGNFEDDQFLVQSWMGSPGHRKNILNSSYREIGVAVGRGMFEGKETWLAIQIFGSPRSICPQPDESLKLKIEIYKEQTDALLKDINSLKAEIEAMRPKRGATYNKKVQQYNNLVNQYNNLVEQTGAMILDYNNQIYLFNKCLDEQIS